MTERTPFVRIAAALLTLTISSSISVCSAIAAKPVVQWTSVREINSGKHQGIVTSTFVQPDPSFSGQGPIVNNIASFTNTSDQTLSPYNLTGLNIPAVGQGLFPATGQFANANAFYSVPGTSKFNSPANSLTMVLQTEDGFYHASSFADNITLHLSNNNGRVNWLTSFNNGNTFAPALGSGAAGRARKEAIVFTGPPTSEFGSINQILPPALTGTAGFIFIQGTNGKYIADNPLDPNSKANFSVITHPDSRFNFEF